MPSLESLFFRQVVEGIVDFDRIEVLRVILEPLALWQIGGIEPFFPVVIIPSGCADSNIAIHLTHVGHYNILNNSLNYYSAKI